VPRGLHPARRIKHQRVVAAPLRVLIADALAFPAAHPGRGYRETGAKAALVEVRELEAALGPLFSRWASLRFACSTWAGSCLCWRLRTVRRQLAPSRLRYLRVCRVLSRMPSSCRAWANCRAVHVRGASRWRLRAAVTCSARAQSLGGPGRWRRKLVRSSGVNCLSTVRT